jgi:phage tail-like protein
MKKLFMNVKADTGQAFASTGRHDPYRDFNYKVTITGKKIFAKVGFNKVTGLKLKTDVIEYRDGADSQMTPHKMSGLVKHDPVTFERGMSEDLDIWNWVIQQIKSNDDGHKCTIVIELLDRARNGVRKWELQECWVSDYETGDFNAQGNGIMIDRMIVQYEGIKTDQGSSTGAVTGVS